MMKAIVDYIYIYIYNVLNFLDKENVTYYWKILSADCMKDLKTWEMKTQLGIEKCYRCIDSNLDEGSPAFSTLMTRLWNLHMMFLKSILEGNKLIEKNDMRTRKEKVPKLNVSFVCWKLVFFWKMNFKKVNYFSMFGSLMKNKLENTFQHLIMSWKMSWKITY